MIRALTLTAALLLTAACEQAQQVGDNLARDSARAAVDEVLVTQFPGIDGTRVTPFTDCIINSASGREIASLARAALVGVDDSTISLVVDISQRPDTTRCFVEAATNSGLSGLLGG